MQKLLLANTPREERIRKIRELIERIQNEQIEQDDLEYELCRAAAYLEWLLLT